MTIYVLILAIIFEGEVLQTFSAYLSPRLTS